MDTTAPIFDEVPADIAAGCDEVPNVPGAGEITATDNCDNDVDIVFAEDIQANSCGEIIIRTWTATDNCGNVATASQTITVGDDIAPEITGIPFDITVDCADIPVQAIATATDNCDDDIDITYTEETIEGICENSFEIIRTWIATDDCGNSASSVQIVIVQDNIPPVFDNIPADIAAGCDEVPEIPSIDDITATDNCAQDIIITFEENIQDNPCGQTITRTWTATDNCNNETTATQVITVGDDGPPVITGIPFDLTVECNEIPPIFNGIEVNDGCDDDIQLVTNDEIIPGNCDGNYTIVRFWSATDDCGNETIESQSIFVIDTQAPVLEGVPTDIIADCDEIPGTPNPGDVTATDNCDNNVDLVFEETIEDTDCGQIITRTWTATDECGNSIAAEQIITVGDVSAPVIVDVPVDATVECDNIPTAADLVAEDDCDSDMPVLFSDVIDPGSCPNEFTITRTWTATDDCGNEATASQILYVVDTTAPEITGAPQDITIDCDQIPAPPANVTATDNCDNNVDITYEQMMNPEDCEESYTIYRTWTATDDCGNVTQYTQEIAARDLVAPELIGVPADMTIDLTAGEVIPNVPTDIFANDNCDDNVDIAFEQSQVPTSDGYILTWMWIATDNCGNTDQLMTEITVIEGFDAQIIPQNPEVCMNTQFEFAAMPNQPGYTYEWSASMGEFVNSNGQTTMYNVTDAGNHEITVIITTPSGSQQTATTTITVSDLTVDLDVLNPSTCGNADGSIAATVAGGSGNYDYAWSSPLGTNQPSLENIAAGNYIVSVTDNETGCTATISVELNDANVVAATVNVEGGNVSCFGASDANIIYSVNYPAGFIQPALEQIVDAQGNIYNNGEVPEGSYCIEVYDGNGCLSGQGCFDVVSPAQLTLDVEITNPTCIELGSIIATPTGGNGNYVFDWANINGIDDGDTNADLLPGFYAITVTDEMGCSISLENIEVLDDCTQCIEPVITNINLTNADCGAANGSIGLEIEGGNSNFTYEWNPSFIGTGSTVANLGGGIYNVTISRVTDPTCQMDTTIILENNNAPSADNVIINPAACGQNTGSATIEFSGDYNIFWQHDNWPLPTHENLAAGTYYVMLLQQGNSACNSIVEVLIPASADLGVTANIVQHPACGQANGQIAVEIDGGSGNFSFAWEDGATTPGRNNLPAGIYSVTVTDNDLGCTGESTVELIDQNSSATVTVTGLTASCFNEATGTVSYDITLAAGFVQPEIWQIQDADGEEAINEELAPGDYCIVVYDGNGCQAAEECFTILQAPEMTASFDAQDTTCDDGGSITLTINGGVPPYSFSWNDIIGINQPQNRTDLAVGEYVVTITDNIDCKYIISLITIDDGCVTLPCESPVVLSIDTTAAFCQNANGIATLNMDGDINDFEYDWSQGSSVTNTSGSLLPGAHSVTITVAEILVLPWLISQLVMRKLPQQLMIAHQLIATEMTGQLLYLLQIIFIIGVMEVQVQLEMTFLLEIIT